MLIESQKVKISKELLAKLIVNLFGKQWQTLLIKWCNFLREDHTKYTLQSIQFNLLTVGSVNVFPGRKGNDIVKIQLRCSVYFPKREIKCSVCF